MKALKVISVFVLLLIAALAWARENKDLMKADFYYTHSAYREAIPYYEKVADTLKDAVIYARLADCYTVTNDVPKAVEWYAKAVQAKDCANGVRLRYAQLLMQLERYTEAEQWLLEYRKGAPNDRRADNLVAGCRLAPYQLKDGDGTAELMSFNTDGSDFAPTVWNGQLVFASDTAIDLKKRTDRVTGRAYYNLYSIPCDNAGNCGSALAALTGSRGVNIRYHNGPCTFSADGRQMWYTRSTYSERLVGSGAVRSKDSAVLLEVMVASDFDTAEKKFRKIEPFQHNSRSYNVAHAALSPDGKVLAFSSNMPGGQGGADIYLCRKADDGWGQPQNAGVVINTEGDEVFPSWGDDQTLFFSSDGQAGMGGLDIYKTRVERGPMTFSHPANVGLPINSSYDDLSLAMNTEGNNAWFSSSRPAAKGGDNIYFFRKAGIFLQVNVIDAMSKVPVAGASITLFPFDVKGDTDQRNDRYFMQLFPEHEYNVEVKKEEYEENKFSVVTPYTRDRDTIIRTVMLTRKDRPRDTISALAPRQLVMRNTNVMDSPGVRGFTVGETYELGEFYFDYNKYEVTSLHQRFLDTMLAQLNRNPGMRVEIQAHTDCRGSESFNRLLSEKRALSVVNYLVQHGITRRRLQYVGLGNSQPKVLCPDCNSCSEEQHSLNRILEFKVLQL